MTVAILTTATVVGVGVGLGGTTVSPVAPGAAEATPATLPHAGVWAVEFRGEPFLTRH